MPGTASTLLAENLKDALENHGSLTFMKLEVPILNAFPSRADKKENS